MSAGVPFGNYRLLGRLNRGGMAEVFLARGTGDRAGTLFAIKRTLPELSGDAAFVAMFADEAKIAMGLSHTNICRIYEQGCLAGQPFLAMEFVHGKDLKVLRERARKRGEAIPPRYAAFILARIAEALGYAHTRCDANGESLGIVHRDVSPQNILVSYDGVPKLIDFGVAKAKDRVAKTRVGVVKGKVAYMSPEQASCKAVDARSDIFALGVVLYELATGHSAFAATSNLSALQRISEARYTPPLQVAPHLPARLAQIIERALAKEPQDRFASGAEMAKALRAVAGEGRPVDETTLSAAMRRLFRQDYIRETARIKEYLAPESSDGGALKSRDSGASAGASADRPGGIDDATVVAPSYAIEENSASEGAAPNQVSPRQRRSGSADDWSTVEVFSPFPQEAVPPRADEAATRVPGAAAPAQGSVGRTTPHELIASSRPSEDAEAEDDDFTQPEAELGPAGGELATDVPSATSMLPVGGAMNIDLAALDSSGSSSVAPADEHDYSFSEFRTLPDKAEKRSEWSARAVRPTRPKTSGPPVGGQRRRRSRHQKRRSILSGGELAMLIIAALLGAATLGGAYWYATTSVARQAATATHAPR